MGAGTTTWDPEQYLRFADERLRPAADLVARVPLDKPEAIWDLGCGHGAPTTLLAARWPEAAIHGLDSSPEMLQVARERQPGIDWVQGDIADWEPEAPVDLIFANAVLHWLDGHAMLLPRLAGYLAPGGVLAVQMPRNHGEPSHRRLFETARSPRWANRVAHLIRPAPVLDPDEYREVLRPLASALDVWEAVYREELEGDEAVANWTKGSVVRPFLDALGEDGEAFFAEYAARVRPDYPRGPAGTTPLAYRRLFIVATA